MLEPHDRPHREHRARSRSRSTTSNVGDLRRDSNSETDDCWVRASSADRRCDKPAALRADSITVTGSTQQRPLIIDWNARYTSWMRPETPAATHPGRTHRGASP